MLSIITFLDILFFSAESFLFFALLFILLFGLFTKQNKYIIQNVSGLMLLVVLLVLCIFWNMNITTYQGFWGLFSSNNFGHYARIYLSILVFLFILLVPGYFKYEGLVSYEYLVLVGYAYLSLLLLISCNDFLSFYICLELQSLALYVLAGYKYFSNFSVEAGLKYFVLGAVSSGILLFGISLLYGVTGTTNFTDLLFIYDWATFGRFDSAAIKNSADLLLFIYDWFTFGQFDSIFLPFFIQSSMLCYALILIGFFFKVGAAPFHMWLPDVYEGAPTITTAFFAIIPKFSILVLLAKVVVIFFYFSEGYKYFLYVGLLSVFLGSIGAIYQNNIKRMLAYSAITHVGYMLLALASYNINGMFSFVFYLVFYSITSVAVFTVVLCLRKYNNVKLKSINNLSTLPKSNLGLSYAFATLLFSIAGIPPLMGFYAKFLVFFSLISSEFYFTAVCVVCLSVISAFYYIRLVKVMFFELKDNFAFLVAPSRLHSYIIVFLVILNIFFFFFIDLVLIFLNDLILSLIIL